MSDSACQSCLLKKRLANRAHRAKTVIRKRLCHCSSCGKEGHNVNTCTTRYEIGSIDDLATARNYVPMPG